MNKINSHQIVFETPQLQAINTKIIIEDINNISGDQNQADQICQSLAMQLEARLLDWFKQWEFQFKNIKIVFDSSGNIYNIFINNHPFWQKLDLNQTKQQLPEFTFETNLNYLMSKIKNNGVDNIKITFKPLSESNEWLDTYRFNISGKVVDSYDHFGKYGEDIWTTNVVEFSTLNNHLLFRTSYFTNSLENIKYYLDFWTQSIEQPLRTQFESKLIDPNFQIEKLFYLKEYVDESFLPPRYVAIYPIKLEHSQMTINLILAKTECDYKMGVKLSYNSKIFNIDSFQKNQDLELISKIINDLKTLDESGQLEIFKKFNQSQTNSNFPLQFLIDPLDRFDGVRINLFAKYKEPIRDYLNVYSYDKIDIYSRNYEHHKYHFEQLNNWVRKHINDLKTKDKDSEKSYGI